MHRHRNFSSEWVVVPCIGIGCQSTTFSQLLHISCLLASREKARKNSFAILRCMDLRNKYLRHNFISLVEEAIIRKIILLILLLSFIILTSLQYTEIKGEHEWQSLHHISTTYKCISVLEQCVVKFCQSQQHLVAFIFSTSICFDSITKHTSSSATILNFYVHFCGQSLDIYLRGCSILVKSAECDQARSIVNDDTPPLLLVKIHGFCTRGWKKYQNILSRT